MILFRYTVHFSIAGNIFTHHSFSQTHFLDNLRNFINNSFLHAHRIQVVTMKAYPLLPNLAVCVKAKPYMSLLQQSTPHCLQSVSWCQLVCKQLEYACLHCLRVEQENDLNLLLVRRKFALYAMQ
jgi:hypothetical protein